MAIYKPKGRNVFVMDFTFKGQRVYETTGETDRKRAQRVHDQRLNDLRDGASGLRPKKRFYYLGEAAEAWQAKPRKQPWSPAMQGIVTAALKKILPAFGKDRLLADIEAADIAEYQKARLAEPKNPSNRSINMDIGVLRKILIYTGHWARLKDEVHMLPERADVGKALTAEQEALLLQECARSVSRALLPFVTLAIDTGARYDTIRTLQWGRVDLQKRRIQIGKDKTAAGTGRVVPLNARALETLSIWALEFPDRKPDHYVFPVSRYGLHGKKGTFGGVVKVFDNDPKKPVGTIQSAWESAKRRTQRRCPSCMAGTLRDGKTKGYRCETCGAVLEQLPAGLVSFRFHDLRHTAVSRMIAAGQPLPIIAKVVGWRLSTVIEMAERYGHFEESAMRRAVEAIAAVPHDSGADRTSPPRLLTN
ncbi:MAG TPA: integrase [Terracidiphilus sp.]|jgi:integrase